MLGKLYLLISLLRCLDLERWVFLQNVIMLSTSVIFYVNSFETFLQIEMKQITVVLNRSEILDYDTWRG